jgi:hypothetical protein
LFYTLAAYWLHFIPSPGKSVAALAVAATIMTFRKDLTGIEKSFLTFVLFLFLLIEVKAIDQDRDENNAKQKAFFQDQHDNFQAVTQQASTNFSTTTSGLTKAIAGLNVVLGATQDVAKLAKQDLENTTGENSFGFAVPQVAGETVPLVVWNSGDQVLSGVSMTIAHTQDPNWGISFFQPIYLGAIGPHEFVPVPVAYAITPRPDEKSGEDNYWITISAQNGTVSESLFFRRRKTTVPWAYSYLVTKHETLKKATKGMPKGAQYMKPLLSRGWSDEVEAPH